MQGDVIRRHDLAVGNSPPGADRRALGFRHLDAETQRAARSFLGRLRGRSAPLDAFVYGSRARGDHGPDSDADVAVILKGRRGNRFSALLEMSDAAYDVLLETGIHIQPLPLWHIEMKRPELFSHPALIEVIKREGVRPRSAKCRRSTAANAAPSAPPGTSA